MRNGLEACHLLHRISDDIANRRFVIGQAIDEGRVGAIFEQAANQIGKQVFVAADRRINTAGLAHPRNAGNFLIERLAHAVQALEFV